MLYSALRMLSVKPTTQQECNSRFRPDMKTIAVRHRSFPQLASKQFAILAVIRRVQELLGAHQHRIGRTHRSCSAKRNRNNVTDNFIVIQQGAWAKRYNRNRLRSSNSRANAGEVGTSKKPSAGPPTRLVSLKKSLRCARVSDPAQVPTEGLRKNTWRGLRPQPNDLRYEKNDNTKDRRAQRFGFDSSLRSSVLCVVENPRTLRANRSFAAQRSTESLPTSYEA